MPLLATEAGLLRRAAGHDPALLDLSRAPRATVVVASLSGHPSFDAPLLARRLDSQASKLGQARRFVAIELDFVRRGRDRVLHPHELASVLERDPSVREVLVRAIRRGLGGLSADAILLPQLLGLDTEVRPEIEAAVGISVGEIVGGAGAAAGYRLCRRLERSLISAGVTVLAARARGIDRVRGALRVSHEGGELVAERLVLATGRHLGGGVIASAEGSRERLLGIPGEGVQVDETARVVALPSALGKARVYACGELALGLDATSGLVAIAASGLKAGFSAAT
jgi:anaerobic glycerol-3-phosphate dehydrogenase